MEEMVFVVGKQLKLIEEGPVWNLIGVFDSEEAAIEACTDETHFIAPIFSNTLIMDEQMAWPNIYFPKKEEKERIEKEVRRKSTTLSYYW